MVHFVSFYSCFIFIIIMILPYLALFYNITLLTLLNKEQNLYHVEYPSLLHIKFVHFDNFKFHIY